MAMFDPSLLIEPQVILQMIALALLYVPAWQKEAVIKLDTLSV